MINWQPLLTQWSSELMATDLATRVIPAPNTNDWLGFDPATEKELAALESRLGVLLPPSYKSFLLVTNGWRPTNPFIEHVRPAAEVDWFRVENESWMEAYGKAGWDVTDNEYYQYPDNGSSPGHRAEHMAGLLQISDVDDGVYLLNSEAVTPDGEWEAWFFANWIPGACRYPSFAHLMFSECQSFRRLYDITTPFNAPLLTIPQLAVARVPAERVRSKAAKAKSLEILLNEIQVDDERLRTRSIRAFFGKLKGRPRAQRRPDLVPLLIKLFYHSAHADVRCACVAALTELADDTPPPTPLFDALSDTDPSVVLQGIFALPYFPNDAAIEPLCRFVQARKNILFNENAISLLGQMGDPKAIPTLLGVLYDTDTKFGQSIGSAGGAIGRCGSTGVDALIDALKHADPRVRVAAVVGIDISGDPRSILLLDGMANDPDESVRRRAAMRRGKFPR